ncbi:PP2C domain-containing protein [Cephalotus follicularis]|uniref:PP2C domain-containing protein n=1 Tax=Cephalotus follicularis TaxID=3775 RepID=A0A1Q3BN58_CEPFO|nr:PP2C domain-containing protein [Cephalotus follicularis]
MGNGITKVTHCFSDQNNAHHDITISDPAIHEGLGHSFFYIRPDPACLPSDDGDVQMTTFRSISGASVSANASVLSTMSLSDTTCPYSSSFESSCSFASGPLQPIPRGPGSVPCSGPVLLSGPISGQVEKGGENLQRSSFHNNEDKVIKEGLIKSVKRVISSKFSCGLKSIEDSFDLERNYSTNVNENVTTTRYSNVSLDCEADEDDDFDDGVSEESLNLQWAQGKAGEDRVQVMISEKKGWIFVGIYDGFYGPDAPDYLLNNLYFAVRGELKGLLWNESAVASTASSLNATTDNDDDVGRGVDHCDVLRELGEALRKTEEAYLEVADKMVRESPQLVMMGSCVLVMLMKGDDVYLMNVGDSRAVLAMKPEPDIDDDESGNFGNLGSIQLTKDHNTNVEEEVKRIMEEHVDDAEAIKKDRVKGSVKVTRAFGAGFLKQPRWNDVVVEVLRVDYVGTSPYLTCSPSLHHHKLSPRDKFLLLSSDGLFDYFTNEEAVSEVESFIASNPAEDPAQHLIEQVLSRAAKKAGMDFYELLDIPQGQRRRYHDDVTVIIVSLEGRIWRSRVYEHKK